MAEEFPHPDFNVISDVSKLLQDVLTAGLRGLGQPPSPIAEINDLQGPIAISPPKLTLFLFEIVEDASSRNRPKTITRNQPPDPPGFHQTKPPMALLLRYLMTAWSGDRLTEHQILGRVLQLFYDQPIITALPPVSRNLSDTGEVLKVTLAPLTLEERTRVWHAVQQKYKLSLSYEVRVVNLWPRGSKPVIPVETRRLDYFEPERVA